MIGHLVACYGAADRYLGMLAATLGEWDRAEAHFAHATVLNRRTGMLTWLGHTLHQHARARIARGDAAGAVPLLSEAAAIAEANGQRALLARIRSIGPEPAAAPEALPDGLSSREVEILRLVARGLSNREVGAALMISEHTAANHMRSILRKTGCANRTRRPPTPIVTASPRPDGPCTIGNTMPLYVIERNFAVELDLTGEDVRMIDEINADEDVRWVFSFLSADRRRTYCLYEAPSPDAIIAAARRADVPVDEVVEVSGAAAPELTGRLAEWAAAQAST